MEESLGWGGHGHQGDGGRAGVLSEYCDLAGVPAKLFDVLLYPFQHHDLAGKESSVWTEASTIVDPSQVGMKT